MARSTVLFLLGAVLVGPAAALLVTWLPPLAVTRIGSGVMPSDEQIEQMRELPSDARLAELRWMAVGAPAFDELQGQEAVRVATRMLDGESDPAGMGQPVAVPFEADDAVLGSSSWSLRLCSLAVPSLLSRAYDVSGDTHFIDEAVRYVLDWSEFENGLLLPKGFVFNDHATAARAVVVSEVWRLYRQSAVYEPRLARALLGYVQKTMRLLRKDRLYEYRSNHGLMQSMSLLHLATAFPQSTEAAVHAQFAADRLLSQIEYFVGPEGAILENSPGYHHFFLKGLAAMWRYIGFWDIPVPEEFVRRYQEAIEFDAAMLRPDYTLPPIGDTGDAAFYPIPTATFDDRRVASRPLVINHKGTRPADDLTLLPVDGYAIAWQGLAEWPDTRQLSQTVLHWNDFPTRAHKHADELGLSIWAGGTQWVTAIGGWPFDETRQGAIGWRSSNAPHWLGESFESERVASLQAYGHLNDLSAFDVARELADGRSIRRQLVHSGDFVWAVVDAMQDESGSAGETIWRFRPDVQLHQVGANRFLLEKPGDYGTLGMTFTGAGSWRIEADGEGNAEWNSPIMIGSTATPAPAVRVLTGGANPVVAAVFQWWKTSRAHEGPRDFELLWRDPENWSLTNADERTPGLAVERNAGTITLTGRTGEQRKLAIASPDTESTAQARQRSIASFENAVERYGRPFNPMLTRRSKVTVAIAGALVLQTIGFLSLPLRFRKWRPFVTGVTVFGWLSLAGFLHFVFLA